MAVTPGSAGRVVRDLRMIPDFPREQLDALAPVLAEFEFRVSAYYATLIDWTDPDDPLRRIVLPDAGELDSPLGFDASDEAANMRVRGLQHMYGPTAVLLVTDVCAAYCRFCFRKRITLATDPSHQLTLADAPVEGPIRETTLDVSEAVRYMAAHPEIDNVLLSGGDPLMLSAGRLRSVLDAVRTVPHVRTIRIGSKLPAFDPDRITPDLVQVLADAGGPDRRVYIVTHFTHPRELTPTALAALDRLLAAGVILTNQTPILRGVNDDEEILVDLLRRLSDAGVPTQYLFHSRPVHGTERFQLTVQRALDLVTAVRPRLSGLAKRFRFIASHATGKIEIVGTLGDALVFRYHEARDPAFDGHLMTWPAGKEIDWLDEVVAADRDLSR